MKLPPFPVRVVVLLLLGGLAIGYKLSRVPRAALGPGATPPALVGGTADWLNSAPRSWPTLAGKVVLVVDSLMPE